MQHVEQAVYKEIYIFSELRNGRKIKSFYDLVAKFTLFFILNIKQLIMFNLIL